MRLREAEAREADEPVVDRVCCLVVDSLSLRPRDEAARSGFARVGGKTGQNDDTF